MRVQNVTKVVRICSQKFVLAAVCALMVNYIWALMFSSIVYHTLSEESKSCDLKKSEMTTFFETSCVTRLMIKVTQTHWIKSSTRILIIIWVTNTGPDQSDQHRPDGNGRDGNGWESSSGNDILDILGYFWLRLKKSYEPVGPGIFFDRN